MKKTFLIIGALLHLIMLVNLGAHFQPGESNSLVQPVRREAHSVGGYLSPAPPPEERDRNFIESRHYQKKENSLKKMTLQALPKRETNNFGLERLIRDLTRTDPGGDFFQLYAGGIALKLGVNIFEEPIAGTDPSLLKRVRNSAPFHPPNRYPPVVIQSLGRLLTLFTPWNAYWFWIVVHELFWMGLLFMGSHLVEPGNRGLVWFFGLSFLPWYAELYMGQTTFLVCWSLVGALFFLKDNRPWRAAAAWAVGLCVKPLGLLFIPPFFRTMGLRALIGAVSLSAGLSAPYFLSHPGEFRLFFSWAFGQELPMGVGSCGGLNFIYHLTYIDYLIPVFTVLVIALSLYGTYTSHFFKGRLGDGAFLWLMTYFLIYAHVWEHHYILMVPGMVFLLAEGRKKAALILYATTAVPSLFWLFGDSLNWSRESIYILWKALPAFGGYAYMLKESVFMGEEG